LKFREKINLIIEEVKSSLSLINEEKVREFIEIIKEAKRIFVLGQGRSGFIAKCFAMRLMHLGFSVYVVGETITPGIEKGELLIVCSSSGEKHLAKEFAKLAKEKEAIVCALTSQKTSSLSRIADLVIQIPIDKFNTKQPLGSLFEQSLFFYLEGVILSLIEEMEITKGEMKNKHTNLE